MAKSKSRNRKKRKPQGIPERAKTVSTAVIEDEKIRESIDPPIRRSGSDKPLFMRIVMLAIAAVMILGIVVGAVAGNAGAFF